MSSQTPQQSEEEFEDYFEDSFLQQTLNPNPNVSNTESSVRPQTIRGNNWEYYYPNWESIGAGHQTAWNRGGEQLGRFYKNQLKDCGYEFNGNIVIYKGLENEFDHQIWKVCKTEGTGAQVSYACKIVGIEYYRLKYLDLHRSVRALLNESEILLQCNHRNVVKVFESIALEDQEKGFPYNFIAIIMEYMSGDLQQLMREHRTGFSEHTCKLWFTHVMKALAYLHNPEQLKGEGRRLVIVHMALRPVNILYKILSETQMVFKLGDFEESFVFDFDTEPERDDFIPEYDINEPYYHLFSDPIMKNPPLPSDLHTRPLDIYSIGFILSFAFIGINRQRMALQRDLSLDTCPPNSIWNVIYSMNHGIPERRPTADQVLTHPWVQNIP